MRQRFLYCSPTPAICGWNPLLIGAGIGLLALLGHTEGSWPWPAFLAAVGPITLSGGYIQDAPFIARGAAGGYAVKVGESRARF
ncbi:MAG: hypothetical protein KatS3mg026_1342 [Bacteroidia bacterium]|nr:MAG: hypothetical protein KatS3mg026_1342 [Bacteroidia bacterium]